MSLSFAQKALVQSLFDSLLLFWQSNTCTTKSSTVSQKSSTAFIVEVVSSFNATCIYRSKNQFSLQCTVRLPFVSTNPTISTGLFVSLHTERYLTRWLLLLHDGCVAHYQAVLCICHISEVLHGLIYFVIEDDNHVRRRVELGFALLHHEMEIYLMSQKRWRLLRFSTYSFRENCFLSATVLEKRQQELGELLVFAINNDNYWKYERESLLPQKTNHSSYSHHAAHAAPMHH